MVEPGGARDIDAAIDRMDPGRAGIRHDDAGGAEDRQAADDAEPAVERAFREPRTVRYADLDLDVAGLPQPRVATSAIAAAIMRRGTGLMAGSPGGTARPGRVTVPTPSPARKHDAAAGRAGAHRRQHERAMGHVGIVARILDDARRRGAVVARREGERKGGALAARQRDLDRVRKFAR